MKKPISLEQYSVVEDYINSLSYNTKITTSKASQLFHLDDTSTISVLAALVDIGVLQYSYVIRCPECNLLLETIENIASIERKVYCYNCEEDVEIAPLDVEVIYTLYKRPFHQGQQNDRQQSPVTSAVRHIHSLAGHVALGTALL